MQNIQKMKCKFSNFDTLWYFDCILSYKHWIEMIIKLWKLKDRSILGMKTSKSSSVVFIVKKSKCRSATLLSKTEIELWPVENILIISRYTELQIGWFLRNWKTNSKSYNFHVCKRVSLVFIIKKIGVEMVPNSRKWKLDPWIRGLNSYIPSSGIPQFWLQLTLNLCFVHTSFLTHFPTRILMEIAQSSCKRSFTTQI